jgi:hypothetical protein
VDEEGLRITDVQQFERERLWAYLRIGSARRCESRRWWLQPCPECKQFNALADPGHALCRRCEGYPA